MTRAAASRLPLLVGGLLFAPGCGDHVRDAVAQQVGDPTHARFQRLVERGGFVCGEVNYREASGRYAGYRRFYFDLDTRQASVDAGPQRTAEIIDPPNCHPVESYRDAIERFECERAERGSPAVPSKPEFDRRWSIRCGVES